MEKHELTCIRCPLGCALVVTVEDGRAAVAGNACPRGAEYGVCEATAPVRTVTSSVRVDGGELPLVSVKTKSDVPKEKIFAVMAEIRKASAKAPVAIGDVLIARVAGTESDVVATRNVGRAAPGQRENPAP